MIPFHKPYRLDQARHAIEQVLTLGKTEGDGPMTACCQNDISTCLTSKNAAKSNPAEVLMMTSGTHALEAALYAINLDAGDEVILPSFAYPSAANAVILAGGTVVYAEVEPSHLTIDPARIKYHITPHTKAILVVHYGGVSCDMPAIMAIAQTHHLIVIEDCAQSFLSSDHGLFTGTIGHFGCFSFHGTKDIVAGEGGALVINHPDYVKFARQFRQKGTNRDEFAIGQVNFYEWISCGSSYAPSEIAMALLHSQLELSDEIVTSKRALFTRYLAFFRNESGGLSERYQSHLVSTSTSPKYGKANGHLFYLLFHAADQATAFIRYLSDQGIDARTHFVPLHESQFGRQFIRPENDFHVEAGLGQRLVRLPLFAALTFAEQDYILTVADRFLLGEI
ncbi:MAG: aminotransferase class I/II-fold pyridoxal phosphate-dependent enzyme [Eubacteriales bacterium]|nr:aminotransferase class I/II-fold pyridoxal phosphate-dependent enzyme [Eubacteriales bacterium]